MGGNEITSTVESTSEQCQKDCSFYRGLIRLIQCSHCSHLLTAPIRLPCGNTICRACIPQTHERKNITYPGTDDRKQGFYCPFSNAGNSSLGVTQCSAAHSLADCGVDVALSRVLEIFAKLGAEFRPTDLINQEFPLIVEFAPVAEYCATYPGTVSMGGGRFIAAYMLADSGRLKFSSDIKYHFDSEIQPDLDKLDQIMLDNLKRDIMAELDCQVCYSLMVDPFTTSCGHTFCRQCVIRTLGHSRLCPICRRKLHMVSFADPGNRNLDTLTSNLFPVQFGSRLENAEGGNARTGNWKLPLFVCTLAFPSMPIYLHIYEPRYRLMILRAMESGDRKFGMVTFNRKRAIQGELGRSEFSQYGTLLEIDRFEILPDGRTLIRATGRHRFKVLESNMVDGYHVGLVKRVDDIRIVEEEQLEAEETTSEHPQNAENGSLLGSLPTRRLFQSALEFVSKRRTEGVSWLGDRALAAYGQPPDDPETFPYWFASVLPIPLEEKYSLLPAISVRERLKICATWVKKFENNEWGYTFLTSAPTLAQTLPFLIIFCIFSAPILLSFFANLVTSSVSSTTASAPQTTGLSFSILPFGFSFTYSSGPLPSTFPSDDSMQSHNFINPAFMEHSFFSKTILFGGIIVVCIARVIRRVSEMLKRQRAQETPQDPWSESTNNNTTSTTTTTNNETPGHDANGEGGDTEPAEPAAIRPESARPTNEIG